MYLQAFGKNYSNAGFWAFWQLVPHKAIWLEIAEGPGGNRHFLIVVDVQPILTVDAIVI